MSTRASAKQQELEEQLARLLSMMELHQQRQEEQFGRLLEEQQQGKLLMKWPTRDRGAFGGSQR